MAAACKATSGGNAEANAGGEGGVEGIASACRSRDLGVHHWAEHNGLVGAEESAMAAIGHDDVAWTQLPQSSEEGSHAHRMTSANKTARREPRRGLAGLQRQRAPALAEARDQRGHQHIGLRRD